MLFIFNYVKLLSWSFIYYFNNYKSTELTKVLIKNIRANPTMYPKLCQWFLPN